MKKAERSRITVTEDEFGGFRVAIPVTPNWAFRLLLPIWLCGWMVFEVIGSMAVASESPNGRGFYFLIFWLCAWTAGGLVACLSLAWNWFGREVVVIDGEWMAIRREIGPLARTTSFELAKVWALRYDPVAPDAFAIGRRANARNRGFGPGSIAFHHDDGPTRGSTTHRFGDRLPEAEARLAIATICERSPIPDQPAAKPPPTWD